MPIFLTTRPRYRRANLATGCKNLLSCDILTREKVSREIGSMPKSGRFALQLVATAMDERGCETVEIL